MSKRRVVITGLGLISPVGNDVETGWANLVAGKSGVGPITRFDASPFPSRIAGEVRDFNPADWMNSKELRHFDTFIHYGVAAGLQAFRDSGLEVTEENAERFGAFVGSGIGGLPLIETTHKDYLDRGARRISPFFVPGSIINLVAGQLSIMLGLQGPSYAIVSACTTGLHCVGDAGRLIAYGDADMMLAGGTESNLSPLGVGGFASMKALSTRNDDPQAASRPWDRDRDGFVLGEGAGVLVLEELEQLERFYRDTERGFELCRVAGGWRLATCPDLAEVLEAAVVAETRARLSQAALETLAVIAYLQPVTRGRVSGVRGVSVDGVVRTLLAHGLITEAGEEPNGAMTFTTTPLFLQKLGLDSLDELPDLAPLLPDAVALEAELRAASGIEEQHD